MKMPSSFRQMLGDFKPTDAREPIHYLHIGKTAGNGIKTRCNAIERFAPDIRFVLHSHAMSLRKIKGNQRYFFSIRNPVTRFQSAFYERKRRGRTGGNLWSADEARSFSYFEHASELAEAIFDSSQRGVLARAAMHSIGHLRKFQHEWFFPSGHFLEIRPPVWIIRQEKFSVDFSRFVQELGIEDFEFEEPPTMTTKVTDYSNIPALTDMAIENLQRWYIVDIHFYQDCCEWLDSRE